MSKFDLNYNQLSSSISYIDKKIFKYADVKDKIEKVAFDLIRFKDGDPDELWQVQNAEDGSYIVAKYEDEQKEVKTATKWETLVKEGNINVFYKGQQITKIAGVKADDIDTVKRFLPKKLATDKSFTSALLATLDEKTKEAVLKMYPELN